jgi:hypothetical protein
MLEALETAGCRVIRSSPPDRAPFQISYEAPSGERAGIVAYAFLANARTTLRVDDRWSPDPLPVLQQALA